MLQCLQELQVGDYHEINPFDGHQHEPPSGERKASETHGKSDRKSTRLNSSHLGISYAVFCLKKYIDLRLATAGSLATPPLLAYRAGEHALPTGLRGRGPSGFSVAPGCLNRIFFFF